MSSMWTVWLSLAVVSLAQGAEAAGPVWPEDSRLAEIRPKLDAAVARVSAVGLPPELVVGKVREGLAKGIAPARIEIAVGRLAESLEGAHAFVSARRPGPASAPLVRAVAEARMAGVTMTDMDQVVRSSRPDATTQRAVEVLTDLSVRGYPGTRAAAMVKDVQARDPKALERVPGALETIRLDHALTHVEATDALARGLAATDSLQNALSRTVEDERRRGHGRGAKSGDGKDAPGKSELAPGRLRIKVRGPRRVGPP